MWSECLARDSDVKEPYACGCSCNNVKRKATTKNVIESSKRTLYFFWFTVLFCFMKVKRIVFLFVIFAVFVCCIDLHWRIRSRLIANLALLLVKKKTKTFFLHLIFISLSLFHSLLNIHIHTQDTRTRLVSTFVVSLLWIFVFFFVFFLCSFSCCSQFFQFTGEKIYIYIFVD